MPWRSVSRDLVRAVRADRSQLAFSRRLGYRSNPVREWEAGRRFPAISEMLRACERSGVEVLKGFARFHPKSPLHSCEPQAISRWLGEIRGGVTTAELSRNSGFSRYAISRWLKGESQPRLPDFLELVEAMTGRASDLLAELVDIRLLPELIEEHRRKSRAMSLSFEKPWSVAILHLLETRDYLDLAEHDDTWVARRLGVEVAEISQGLEAMLQTGLVTWQGAKFAPGPPVTIETHGELKRENALKAHWGHVAAKRMAQAHADDRFSYNLMSVSHADLQRIHAMLSDTYREIRSLVAASNHAQTVALLQLNLMEWRAIEEEE